MNIQQGGFQSGGVFATGNKPIREEVYDMLNTHPLQYIDTQSTYGVIFSLDFDSSKATNPFLDLETNEKVHSFIIKLEVINDTPYSEDGTSRQYTVHEEGCQSQTKSCSTFGELLYESNVQQYVWAKSLSGGRESLCPPVVDLLIIDSDNIDRVSDNGMIQRFYDQYVQSQSSSEFFKLGLIIMPMVPNHPMTLFNWILNRPGGVYQEKTDIYSTVISQVLRLFLDIGVIHFDLHANNILVYYDKTKKGYPVKTKLIDFDMASIVTNTKDDAYLDKSRKSFLATHRKDNLRDITRSRRCDTTKKNFVTNTLTLLKGMNEWVYRTTFLPPDSPYLTSEKPLPPGLVQLERLTSFILPKGTHETTLSEILCKAYDKFWNSMQIQNSSIHPMEELQAHMAQGKIYNYKLGNILNVEDEDTPVQSCTLGTRCTIMGGGKRPGRRRTQKRREVRG